MTGPHPVRKRTGRIGRFQLLTRVLPTADPDKKATMPPSWCRRRVLRRLRRRRSRWSGGPAALTRTTVCWGR